MTHKCHGRIFESVPHSYGNYVNIYYANAATYQGTCLDLTGGKFQNESAEHAPHNRENGRKIIREVNVFSVSLKSL